MCVLVCLKAWNPSSCCHRAVKCQWLRNKTVTAAAWWTVTVLYPLPPGSRKSRVKKNSLLWGPKGWEKGGGGKGYEGTRGYEVRADRNWGWELILKNKQKWEGRNSSPQLSNPSAWFQAQKCICLQGENYQVDGDLLDVVGICHCCWEGTRRGWIFYGFCERAQDVARHPALSGRWLAVGRPENKVHVLLVGGQDLNCLALTDRDLVLLERRVVLSNQHGWGDAVTAAIAVLMRRENMGEKRTGEEKTKRGWGEQGDRWKGCRGRGRGQLRARLGCVYEGRITVLLTVMLIQLTPAWVGEEGRDRGAGGGGGTVTVQSISKLFRVCLQSV